MFSNAALNLLECGPKYFITQFKMGLNRAQKGLESAQSGLKSARFRKCPKCVSTVPKMFYNRAPTLITTESNSRSFQDQNERHKNETTFIFWIFIVVEKLQSRHSLTAANCIHIRPLRQGLRLPRTRMSVRRSRMDLYQTFVVQPCWAFYIIAHLSQDAARM